jgi:hypothetical protein
MEATLINRVQAGIGIGSCPQEGKKPQTDEDYWLSGLTDKKEQGKGNKSDEAKG